LHSRSEQQIDAGRKEEKLIMRTIFVFRVIREIRVIGNEAKNDNIRRLFVLVLTLLLMCTMQAEPVRKNINSSISAVTVYLDRASVTRQAALTLQPGTYALVFANLPVMVIDNSVRVSGEAARAKILDVQIETSQLDTIPEERFRELTAQLTLLRDQQQELVDRSGTVAAERDFVLQIKAQSSDNISKDLKVQRPTVEDWQKIILFLDQNLTKFSDELRRLAKERSLLQEKIDAIQRQLDGIGPRRSRAVKNIVVQLEVAKPGEVRLSSSYVLTGAQWYPQYDVRIATESKSVELRYAGMVRQFTGEDWSNVSLSLSTARPDIGGVKPDLSPWFLSVFEGPRILKGARMQKMDAGPESVRPMNTALDAAAAPIEMPDAEVLSQATSALFRIKAPATIPSDNTPHRVTVAIASLEAALSHSSVPKLAPYVYAKAAVKNITEFPFLPGAMNVYADDDFITTSAMKAVSPGESFDAYLGVDPMIKAERRLVNKTTESVGTFTKSVRITYEFSYTLVNTRATNQTVLVQDQVPLSQNEKITITQLEPTEKEVKPDEQGQLSWTFAMAPAEKKTWKLKFSIEYPQGTAVIGVE
jgi:uncharacterized protein (TIGR02231 family)